MRSSQKIMGVLLAALMALSLFPVATMDVSAANRLQNSNFIDVPAEAYYAEAVRWAVEKGVTSGTSAKTFSPQTVCDRAQLVTFLWRASGSPIPANTVCIFTDVSPDAYYYNAILWALENGIASGTSATTFSPGSPVNRGQAVTFLYRAAGSPAVKNTTLFTDVEDGAYFANAVVWAAEQNIAAGTAAETFGPFDSCTRGQTVTFLYRFFANTSIPMRLYETNGIKYWLYTPENEVENMPLIVYLHGSSGRGDNPERLLTLEELPKFLTEGRLGDIPAYVLIPQIPSNKKDWMEIKEDVVSMIQEVAASHPIDRGNISLTGFSMGGAGVWNIAASYPELFRCIAPCSGGVRATKATFSALRDMKIWAFVGTADVMVDPQSTIDFIEQLAHTNPQASITKFDGATHIDVPALAYLNDEIDLIHWLISK